MALDDRTLQIFNDAVALHQAGQLDQAKDAYREILSQHTDHAQSIQLLGVIALQEGDQAEAIRLISKAIEFAPNAIDFRNNLGLAWIAKQQYSQAIKVYQEAITLAPQMTELHFNLGVAYQATGAMEMASASYRRAYELDRSAVDALLSSIHVRQYLCDWEGMESECQTVCLALDQIQFGALTQPLSPLSVIALPIPTTSRQQYLAATKWAERSSVPIGRLFKEKLRSYSTPIRVGYISADMRNHPVGWLLPELIESHDRTTFKVFGYRTRSTDDSEIAKRLDRAFDSVSDLSSLSTRQAAQQIADDEIDILIDLQGHTQDDSIAILARRPAAIQVSYLGYPGTLGSPSVDYLIADEYVLPVAQREWYSEKIVSLPGCFMAQDSRTKLATPPTRTELELPEDGIVLCAFSSYHKLTPALMSIWFRAMKGAPKSFLWLRDGPALAMSRIRALAQSQGVTTDRIIFAPMVSRPEHLARQAVADIFLDTFPYNQHSTAADALRVGLPILSLSGDTFASRVAGSLLSQLKLTTMISTSFIDYERKLIELIHSPDKLRDIRNQLRSTLATSKLFDGAHFALQLEAALRKMFAIQEAGHLPRSFSVTETE